MKVNLHTHSTASDGALSPKDLIKKLALDHVEVCALTDHDSIQGIIEAKQEAALHNIRFINGVEISTKIDGLGIEFLDENNHTLHILALDFDFNVLHSIFENREKEKEHRLAKLVEELKRDGYHLDLALPIKKKTHIAMQMVKQHYANDIQMAFNTIINRYYDRNQDNMTIDIVVDIVHKACGKVIWAHPFEILNYSSKVQLNEIQVEYIVSKLKTKQIDGLEVYYEAYNEQQKRFLKHLAHKYNLISSCGTDYHGKVNRSVPFIDIDENLIKEVLE